MNIHPGNHQNDADGPDLLIQQSLEFLLPHGSIGVNQRIVPGHGIVVKGEVGSALQHFFKPFIVLAVSPRVTDENVILT